MILSAQSVRKLCQRGSESGAALPMIFPFHERTIHHGKTFGLSAAGYDVRVEFAVGNVMAVCPGDFILASTIEHFVIPNNIIGIVHDKSSWARRGLTVQNTVIEPGWAGFLTLELTHHGYDEIILERGYPIAQIVFHMLDKPTEQPYDGKYQNQARGPQPAKDD